MIATMRLTSVLALVAVLFCLIDLSEANYKNAPMNGIMFGKRVPSGDYYLTREQLFMHKMTFFLVLSKIIPSS